MAGLRWWHRIDVAPGVVTPGGWDLRPLAARMAWPPEVMGGRCLDVGTMDGFWAFELERRGAKVVVASDLADPTVQDSPVLRRRQSSGSRRGESFRVAADLLGSKARYLDLSVYDLDPSVHGRFDVIVMGYVLQMLRDPLRALEALRAVCTGHLLVIETVSLPLSAIPAPVARLDARSDGSEWFVFNRRGLRKSLELAGWEVETVTPPFRDRFGPPAPGESRPLGARAMHAAGARGISVVAYARPAG